MYGVEAGTALTAGVAFIGGLLSYYSGDVRHDGQTQAGAPITTCTDEEIFDGSAIVGFRFGVRGGFDSAGFAGVGYRNWQRNIRGTGSVRGLDETYYWWYASLGIRATYIASKKMTWGVDLRFVRPINPKIDVNFGNELDNIKLELSEETGYRVAARWQYLAAPHMMIQIRPFYEYWELGRSSTGNLTQRGTVIGTVVEPRSETKNRGINMSLSYRF